MKEETEGIQNVRSGSFTDPEVKEAYEELFSESGHEKVSHNIFSVAIIILFYYFSGLFDDLFVGIGIFLTVVLAHEAGHYFFMRHRGFIFPGMFLFPFLIGIRDGAKGDNDAAGRAMAYLAGPLPGIIIGLGLLIISNFVSATYFAMVGVMFVSYNGFNLLPLSILDGGAFLYELHSKYNKYIQISVHLAAGLVILYYIPAALVILILAVALNIFYSKGLNESLVEELRKEFPENNGRDFFHQDFGVVTRVISIYNSAVPDKRKRVYSRAYFNNLWRSLYLKMPSLRVRTGLTVFYVIILTGSFSVFGHYFISREGGLKEWNKFSTGENDKVLINETN